MFIWLVDDDKEMLTGFETLVNSKSQFPDTLNIELRIVKKLSEFESAVNELSTPNARFPDLIFLDLKFKTTREGYIALDMIKNHHSSEVRAIPTIMFSSAKDEHDIRRSYRKSANAYVEKGADQYDRFISVVQHWAAHAALPQA